MSSKGGVSDRKPKQISAFGFDRHHKSFTLTSGKPEPKAVFRDLREHGVVCDFREPGSIRLAPVPMYNKFSDVFDFVNILKNILHSE